MKNIIILAVALAFSTSTFAASFKIIEQNVILRLKGIELESNWDEMEGEYKKNTFFGSEFLIKDGSFVTRELIDFSDTDKIEEAMIEAVSTCVLVSAMATATEETKMKVAEVVKNTVNQALTNKKNQGKARYDGIVYTSNVEVSNEGALLTCSSEG